MPRVVVLRVIMLRVVMLRVHYAEVRYAEDCYAEIHYAETYYAESRGAFQRFVHSLTQNFHPVRNAPAYYTMQKNLLFKHAKQKTLFTNYSLFENKYPIKK